MDTKDILEQPQILIEHLEKLGKQTHKRLTAKLRAALKRVKLMLKQVPETLKAEGGPDPKTLADIMRAMSNPALPRDSAFATSLQQYYTPLIEQALASSGINKEDFWKEILPIVEISDEDWKRGDLLTGELELKPTHNSERR